MDLLKKESAWGWLFLYLFTTPILPTMILGGLYHCYPKKAWYRNPDLWIGYAIFFLGMVVSAFFFLNASVILLVLAFLPLLVSGIILFLQTLTKLATILNVPGQPYYTNPINWIILFLIPLVGWFTISTIILYLSVMIVVQLYQGEGTSVIEKRGVVS